MNEHNRAVLILAGGAGTRLWPLSTDEMPKQFLKLFGGLSLIQMTWARVSRLAEPGSLFVSTNERYAALVAEQLPELPRENILVEPARRNTAPAIAACCATIARRHSGVTIGIFPSDHAIADEEGFIRVLERAFDHANSSEDLVTIGLQPTEPSTGYGYLELGDSLGDGLVKVERFVEKPDQERAKEFVESGRFVWSGGMFVWRAEVFLNRLRRHAPEIANLAEQFAATDSVDQQKLHYEKMPSISIDYALMEKSSNVAAATGEFGWSDVGSWKAVATIAGSPAQEKVIIEESENVFIRTTGDKPVVVVGLSEVAVIDSPEGLLVINLDRTESLSRVVKKLH